MCLLKFKVELYKEKVALVVLLSAKDNSGPVMALVEHQTIQYIQCNLKRSGLMEIKHSDNTFILVNA